MGARESLARGHSQGSQKYVCGEGEGGGVHSPPINEIFEIFSYENSQ